MPRSIRPMGTTAMDSDEEEDDVGELTELLTPEEVLKGQTESPAFDLGAFREFHTTHKSVKNIDSR